MSQTTETADVGTQKLARVYATSLLDVADKAGQTDAILEEVDTLVDEVFRQQPNIETFFSSPAVGRNARKAAIEKGFTDRTSDLMLRFLLILNGHERLGLLRPIRAALHDLRNERNRRVVVQVFSPIALNDDQQNRVRDTVRHRFGLEPNLKLQIDPSMLGGLRLRIGDQQYDLSVRTRLEEIRNQILARSSYEIQSRRDRFSN